MLGLTLSGWGGRPAGRGGRGCAGGAAGPAGPGSCRPLRAPAAVARPCHCRAKSLAVARARCRQARASRTRRRRRDGASRAAGRCCTHGRRAAVAAALMAAFHLRVSARTRAAHSAGRHARAGRHLGRRRMSRAVQISISLWRPIRPGSAYSIWSYSIGDVYCPAGRLGLLHIEPGSTHLLKPPNVRRRRRRPALPGRGGTGPRDSGPHHPSSAAVRPRAECRGGADGRRQRGTSRGRDVRGT